MRQIGIDRCKDMESQLRRSGDPETSSGIARKVRKESDWRRFRDEHDLVTCNAC